MSRVDCIALTIAPDELERGERIIAQLGRDLEVFKSGDLWYRTEVSFETSDAALAHVRQLLGSIEDGWEAAIRVGLCPPD